jgi:SAM-dependent methyltransferase
VDTERRSRSFGQVAERYDRFRPAPPLEAVEWLLPRPVQRAVDLGAGTGGLTRRLRHRAEAVLGMEPDPRMRAVLTRSCLGCLPVGAVGERLPLAARSVDAVVVSSAWHWMDSEQALAEVARVLRPGGIFGALGNGPDRSVDWVARALGDWRRSSGELGREPDRWRRHEPELSAGAPFEGPSTHTVSWTLELGPGEVEGLVGTYSGVITLPPEARDSLMEKVRAEVAPLTASRGTVEVPFRCRCWRAVRR